jgi:NitT/TauT family transport system permease protein
MLYKGQLQEGFVIAAEDLLTGYILAIVVGMGVGLLMGRNRIIEQVLNPYINFMQATPLVAVVPLIVIWLGIGFSARVAVVFILALWSVIINTSTGVKTVPRVMIDVARVYHLSERRIMREIALPNAVPHIFAGLRIALGKALIGMIIAEMEISIVGLGGLLSDYGNSFKTAYLLAGIFTASLVGVATAIFLEWSLARFFPWVAATSAERD